MEYNSDSDEIAQPVIIDYFLGPSLTDSGVALTLGRNIHMTGDDGKLDIATVIVGRFILPPETAEQLNYRLAKALVQYSRETVNFHQTH